MRFTQQFLKGLAKPQPGRRVVYEDSGLAVRVGKTGTVAWLWRYDTPAGVRRQLGLGSWPAVSLAEARQLQAAARLEVERGGDPAARGRQAGETVADLWLHFEAHRLPALAARTRAEYARQYQADLAPAWARRKAADVTRRDVSDLVLQVKARALATGRAGATGSAANRLLALAGALFAHGLEHGLVSENPAAGLKGVVAYHPRERILSPAEIRDLWPRPGSIAACLRFALLTGQRIGAVAAMQPGEVDLPGRLWTVPADDGRKLKKPNQVPLSPLALELLPSLAPCRVDSASSWCQRAGLSWRPHDLRRTALTGLRELGVSEETAGRIAGHRPATVLSRVYDKGAHLDELRHALNLWADQIQQWLS
jgi:integrase